MIHFNRPYMTGRETEYIRQAVEGGKISGNGEFTIDLGTPETLPLAGMRYLETDLSRNETVAAWTNARFNGAAP